MKIEKLTKTDLFLVQKEKGFKITLDSVLISTFANVNKIKTAADLGCGTGGILFLLKYRKPSLSLSGFELNRNYYSAVVKGIQLNGFENQINVYNYDIRNLGSEFNKKFDMVISNPPYNSVNSTRISENSDISDAKTELNGDFDDFSKTAFKLLKNKGKFVFIHSSKRFPEIMKTLNKNSFSPKRLRFVHPYINKKSNVFMMECTKYGGSFLNVEPPLIVYKDKKIYTDEILSFYRNIYDS